MRRVAGLFLISGYSIAASITREPAGYGSRRFWRIWPVYAAALIIGYAVLLARGGFIRLPRAGQFETPDTITLLGSLPAGALAPSSDRSRQPGVRSAN